MNVSYTDADVQAAKDRADHWHDALHLLIAEREADVVITRNKLDFEAMDPQVSILLPEEALRLL